MKLALCWFKAMKRPKIPKLTPEHKKKRLNFCLERRKWTVNDWKKVIFSDESPYLLFPEGNSKNDIVWAKNSSDVEPRETVKFSPKIMVWGAISGSSLSELHIVPQNTSVTAGYYTENILAENLLPMFTGNRATGSLVGRRLVDVKSEMIFMQDGARAHTAAATSEWLQENEIQFWGKEVWPPNSPDLNPKENVWAILEEVMVSDKGEPRTLAQLEKSLVDSWKKIRLETLKNLYLSMPSRILDVIRCKGGYPI